MRFPRFLLWCVLLAAVLPISIATPSNGTINTVKVGLMYSGSGIFAVTGLRTKTLMSLWEELANNNPNLGFHVQVVLADVASNAALVSSACESLKNQNVSFLVAPEGGLSILASQCANRYRIPVLSRVALTSDYKCPTTPYPAFSDCRRAGDRAFNFAYSVLQPSGYQFRDYYGMVKVKGALTVAIVYFDDNFHTETCLRGQYYATLNNLNVVYVRKILANYTNSIIVETVRDLKRLNPDVVTWCRRLGCVEDITAFKQENYLPPSPMFVQCTDTDMAVQALGDDARYLSGVKFWDVNLRGDEYTDVAGSAYASYFPAAPNRTSAHQFSDYIVARTGIAPTFTDANTFAVGYMIEATVATAPSMDVFSYGTQIARVDVKSFYGSISSDFFGMNSGNPVIVTQVDSNNQLQIISPTSAVTSSFVYPVPTWSERTYSPVYAGTTGSKVTIALVAVSLFFYLVSMSIICIHRNSPLIKSLNTPMILTSFVGAILLSLANLTWLDHSTPTTCKLVIPAFVFGLTVMILPMIVQSYLLNKIFHNTSMRVVKLSKWKLVGYFNVVAVPVWIITIILVSRFTLEPKVLVFDPLRPSTNMTVCQVQADRQSQALACGMVLLVVFVVELVSWWIIVLCNHDVDHQLFSETKRIMLAAGLMVFLLGLAMAVEFGLPNSDATAMATKQLIRGVAIQIVIFLSMAVLYFSRLYDTVKQRGLVTSIQTGTNNATALGSAYNNSSHRSAKKQTVQPAYIIKEGESERQDERLRPGACNRYAD